jgi:hypothetical protein
MVIQQQHNLSTSTQNEHLHRLVIDLNLDDVQRQQPVLAVQIGYHLDPGIRRKDLANEDTVSVMQGKIPSDSPKRHWQEVGKTMSAPL